MPFQISYRLIKILKPGFMFTEFTVPKRGVGLKFSFEFTKASVHSVFLFHSYKITNSRKNIKWIVLLSLPCLPFAPRHGLLFSALELPELCPFLLGRRLVLSLSNGSPLSPFLLRFLSHPPTFVPAYIPSVRSVHLFPFGPALPDRLFHNFQ